MEKFEYLFNQARTEIEQANNILLVTHYKPDGDGLSSVCAMAEYLSTLKITHSLYCYSEPPKTFEFLAHLNRFAFTESLEGQKTNQLPIDFSRFDLIIVFDCGELARTRLSQEILNRLPKQKVIEFDHHPKIDSYADIEIREPTAAATAEVIYHYFRVNKIKISKTIANILITGFITDTASFLYPSTSSATLEAVSDLVRQGAHLPRVTDYTLRNKSIEAMKLWGRIMSNLQINRKYNIAFTILPKEEFIEHQINQEELEGVSGFLSNLHGVSAIMFLREEPDGMLRGSLRTSQPKIDVSALAKLLGGGGHAKASGFSLKGQLRKNKNWQVI